MAFDPAEEPGGEGPPTQVPFDGFAEEWRLVGDMLIVGRLSDALNRRELIETQHVRSAPIDAVSYPVDLAGDGTLDPYELMVVLSGAGSLPAMEEDRRVAHRLRKNSYDVILHVPPLRVQGRVHLWPGVVPDALMERQNELFVAVTGAKVWVGERLIEKPLGDLALVNRSYLRAVQTLDTRDLLQTAERPRGETDIGWDRMG